MPAHQLHIELADTLLSDAGDWRAPEWADDPDAVNAFYHGALGPDMGFFPGADSLLVGLAHYLRPGVLLAEMLARAGTAVEQAYAWGWGTHLVADVEAHAKVVNVRCGELRFGTRGRSLPYQEAPAEHIAVEVGLDAARLGYLAGADRVRLRPALDHRSVGMLGEALRATYDVEISTRSILRSHRAVARFQPMLFRLIAFMGRGQEGLASGGVGAVGRGAIAAIGFASRKVAPNSRLTGVTNPDPPASWVEGEIASLKDAFPSTFERHLAAGFEELAEVNIDTGADGDPTSDYFYSVDTRRRLEKRRR